MFLWPIVLETRVVATLSIYGDQTQRLAFVEDARGGLYLLDLAEGLDPEVGDEMNLGMERSEEIPVARWLWPK